MRRPSLLLLLACLCAVASAAGDGARDPHADIVRLRIEPGDGDYLAWADNLLAGPIEVRLDVASGEPPSSQPALPARAGVPAGGSALVARLHAPDGREGWLRLRLRGVPGSTNARPRDVLYLPPLAATKARIDQGFEGEFSHQDAENRYALDFATPVGTPVLAARAGVVMQVQDGFRGHGLDYARDGGRANFIRILHDDGSMALYAHLAEGGVLVRVGEHVDAGQRIGLSGNTGYSTAPHLHFAVQVNRSLELQSIRFRMRGLAE
ncbi:M23 family metallopeptidase [Thermomonas brevis]